MEPPFIIKHIGTNRIENRFSSDDSFAHLWRVNYAQKQIVMVKSSGAARATYLVSLSVIFISPYVNNVLFDKNKHF